MTSTIKNIFDLGLLFEQVQTESVFPDNKTFPDCIAKDSLDAINEAFLIEKESECFDLKAFVMKYFDLPINRTAAYERDKNHSIEQHLQTLWTVLTREPEQENSSLIPLPKPYIVPGGRFGEVYYWDSYFTMLGLRASGRIDMIESMVDNFSYLIDKIGHIPNGNRSYYVGRSQPPFYSLMVKLLSEEKGLETLVKHLPHLKKEYDFWMLGSEQLTAENNALHRVVLMPNGTILNRFWDENNTPRPESFKEDFELSHQSTQDVENAARWTEVNRLQPLLETGRLRASAGAAGLLFDELDEEGSLAASEAMTALVVAADELGDDLPLAQRALRLRELSGAAFDADDAEETVLRVLPAVLLDLREGRRGDATATLRAVAARPELLAVPSYGHLLTTFVRAALRCDDVETAALLATSDRADTTLRHLAQTTAAAYVAVARGEHAAALPLLDAAAARWDEVGNLVEAWHVGVRRTACLRALGDPGADAAEAAAHALRARMLEARAERGADAVRSP